MTRRIVIGQGVVDWVAAHTQACGGFGSAVGIGLESGGKLIAGVAYSDWNGVNIVAHIASDGSKLWMTREYLRTIFDYPFNQAKVNRITCWIAEGNKESIKLCEHIGFKLETTLSEAHPTGDLLIYRMRRQDCRWLAIKVKHEEKMAA